MGAEKKMEQIAVTPSIQQYIDEGRVQAIKSSTGENKFFYTLSSDLPEDVKKNIPEMPIRAIISFIIEVFFTRKNGKIG